MWTSYGRRADSLGVPAAERLLAPIARFDRFFCVAAIATLFAYPNPFTPLALLLLAAVLLSRLVAPRARQPALALHGHPALHAGFALLVSGTLLGLVLAHDTDAAGLRATGVVASVAVFYLGASWVQDERAMWRWTTGLLAAVIAGIFWVLALLRGQLPDSLMARALGPILAPFSIFPGVAGDTLDVNARFMVHQYGLAHLLLVASSYAVAGLVFAGSPRSRVLAGVALVAMVPPLLATQSRGAIIAAAVSAAAVAALRTRWAWGLLPASGGMFYLLLTRGVISRGIEADWLNDRLSYWTRTLAMLGDFPFAGAGLGIRTFAKSFAWYYDLPDPYQVTHAHNVWLQAYVEQGLPGLVGLGLVVIGGTWLGFRAARAARGPRRWMVGGAAGALLGSALYGITDQVPTTNLSLGLICALLVPVVVCWPAGTPAGTPGLRAGLDRRILVLLGSVMAVGAALLVPRWASGLLLNVGSADLVAAALERSTNDPLRAERLERAEWALEAAVRWNGNNVAASRNLAWTRALRHDIPGAYAAIAVADRADLNAFERMQLARAARAAGLIGRAIELLRDGRDEARLRDVAAQMWSERRWSEAAAAYAALSDLNPEEAEYASNAAYAVLNGGGDAETAMELLREAVSRNPEAARNLARQLVLRGEPCRSDERRGGGRLDCAVFWFGLASRVDPTYDRPEVELGSALYYRGRYAEAAEHFAEAARRDPRNPSTYSQLANAYVSLGRLDEAIRVYEQGVAVRPERADLRLYLARAYLASGRREDGLRELRAAVELAPGDAAYAEELRRVEAGR